MKEVSVIIPTYGKPQYLEKAIKSVLNQTFQSIQLIVVDDNDSESEYRKATEQVVEKYVKSNGVLYIKHAQNMNGAVARNTGISYAEGKYISFLDSDDEYLPTRIESCYNVMESAQDSVAGVYTGCEFRRNGKTYHIEKNVNAGNYLVETLACTFMFCTGSNIFMRHAIVQEINGFDGEFLRHQDYEFLVRVFEKYDIDAINEVLVIKNNENVNRPNVDKIISIKEQYLRKYRSIIEKLPSEKQKFIYRAQYYQIAELAMKNKQYTLANEYYKKVATYKKMSGKETLRRLAFRFFSGR